MWDTSEPAEQDVTQAFVHFQRRYSEFLRDFQLSFADRSIDDSEWSGRLALRYLLGDGATAWGPKNAKFHIVGFVSLFDERDGRVVTEGSVYNCISELRGILASDEKSTAAIETIPKKGYRLVATVTAHAMVEPPPGPHRSKRMAVLLAVGIVVVAALLFFLPQRDGEQPDIRSLAVLPLENHSPDPTRDAYFTDGMTEALIARLSRIGGLKVISRTSSMQLKKSDMTVPEIANALNVDGVIEGSVMTADQEVRITLQLIDGKTDTHLWTSSYVRSFDDVLDLQEEIANAIAGELRVHVVAADGSPLNPSVATPRPVTESPEAYRAYLQGRFWPISSCQHF